ncbi:MAG: DUF4412 domain-containing protein, partial [Chlorobiales bacterium]|nr:DUF4412 domain-containing protein [Chlorobiales bacterium]
MRKIIPFLVITLFQLSLLSACQQKPQETTREGVSSEKPGKSLTDGLFRKKFEGILHMQISAPEGSQKGKLFISKNGTRFEIDLADPETGTALMHLATFTPSDEPNLLYTLNEQAKTYSVIDMSRLIEDLEAIETEE